MHTDETHGAVPSARRHPTEQSVVRRVAAPTAGPMRAIRVVSDNDDSAGMEGDHAVVVGGYGKLVAALAAHSSSSVLLQREVAILEAMPAADLLAPLHLACLLA